jgi:hypothetical protein
MKIVIKWNNPWVRAVLYACLAAALFLAIGGDVRFIYQGF